MLPNEELWTEVAMLCKRTASGLHWSTADESGDVLRCRMFDFELFTVAAGALAYADDLLSMLVLVYHLYHADAF